MSPSMSTAYWHGFNLAARTITRRYPQPASCAEIQVAIDHEEFGWGIVVARRLGRAAR
jgi:hypothetical protein